MADRTAPSSDARKRNAEAAQDSFPFTREWLRWMSDPTGSLYADPPTDQENPMSKTGTPEPLGTHFKDHLAMALFAAACTIKWPPSADDWRVLAEIAQQHIERDFRTTNLAAIKHEAETPMREHGECCEPAEAELAKVRESADGWWDLYSGAVTRYEALRADVADHHRGANSLLIRGELRGILDRDDERARGERR